MALPELIQRSVLFGNPDHLAPTVSPDGSQLGWVALLVLPGELRMTGFIVMAALEMTVTAACATSCSATTTGI